MKKSLLALFCVLFFFEGHSQHSISAPDSAQYPLGFNDPIRSAIQQLKNYPLPRYFPGTNLRALFNWMDPYYMGGNGQKGLNRITVIENALNIQKELIANWHYGIVIPNAGTAFYDVASSGSCPSFIQLANENPKVPLHVITFWMASNPQLIGYPYNGAMILNRKLDSSLYLTFDFYGHQKTEIKFNFPDSLISIDGHVQKYNLSRIVKCLTRPIDLINENGEEPPGPYLLDAIQKDKWMIHMKDSMKIISWEDFTAQRKLQMRNKYSFAFLGELPELKKTNFSFYTVEGGPKDRFEWTVMKKCMTPVNGIYYSTPDFYPRWPSNWKYWKGPWHGWQWIESGREKEIKDGDILFSPFVSAGWSKDPEEDIRPGQWLGLLKCLSVVGAEFYYVGYFNLSAPFNDPAQWVWQSAMPSYAQAITSRFEDVLKDGNVLFDAYGKPIISYPTDDKHILVAVRKHNKKEKYVICGTYQPFSNEEKEIPEKINTTITIGGEKFSFEVRRQGSVYIYEKTSEGKILFYQLDKWHENSHPDHWKKEFYFEAEVSDSTIDNADIFTVNNKTAGDYRDFVTYVSLRAKKNYCYNFTDRDPSQHARYMRLRYRGNGTISITLNKSGIKEEKKEVKLPSSENWKWYKIALPENNDPGENMLLIRSMIGTVDIDQFVISEKDTAP